MDKFDWNDVVIEPAVLSDISSRKEINILDKDGNIPLFVSPMDTVIDENNYKLFLENNYNVCLVRGMDYKNLDYEKCFVSFGIDEIIEQYKSGDLPPKILIDVANAHMKRLYTTAKDIKVNYPNIELMIGNIANPKTYNEYTEIGVDWIRVGIGGGSGCTTSANGAIHYPMASLVKETHMESMKWDKPAKILADGGFKNYSDIIKGLALGADSVMLGGILNKCIESAGDCYWKGIKVPNELVEFMYSNGFKLTKKFRGMSTKEVQEKWGRKILKTSEGIVTKGRKVEYTLQGWTENFQDYLKSAMSYTNSKNLNEFVGNVNYNLITQHAYQRFNK